MELFGLALSVPVAFVASALYCFFLTRVLSKFELSSRWLRLGSWLVFGLLGTELALLVSLGTVHSRERLGPGFYIAHLILFFAGPPALANLLVLRSHPGFLGRWYIAGALSALLAFCLVLLQYSVSESLYGINGDDGPYSKGHSSTSPGSSRPLP
jgi:hypothetical protein